MAPPDKYSSLAGPPPQPRRHPLRDCASCAAPARARYSLARRPALHSLLGSSQGPRCRCTMRSGTAAAWDGGPLRLLRRRNPPPRLRALHPHPARGWRRACSARFARFASVAGGRPAGAFFALMACGHQRGARLAVARVLAPARPLRAAFGGGLRPALPGLCALAGRGVGARAKKGPLAGLGLFWPSACAGRASARPAATPLHWPACVAPPRPCASRRAGPGGCPACGPGRACGPRICMPRARAGCLRFAQATRPDALRARRSRGVLSGL